jgi:uncharacterized protein
MGHCDSSARLSRDREVLAAGGRAAETISSGAGPEVDRRPSLSPASSATSGAGAGAWLLLTFVRLYQIFLGPFFGGACKFHPSCSVYAQEAIARHGALRGTVLALKRLGRCRPFTRGGYDPVPDGNDADMPPSRVSAQEPVQ